MKSFLLILSLYSFTALARPGDGEIGPPIRPSLPPCDMLAVNACRADEISKRDSDHARAHSLDVALASLGNKVSEAAREKSAAFAYDGLLAKEQIVLQDEISYLNRGESPGAKEIIPGFASVEDLFGLTPDERGWHESYPTYRAELLDQRLKALGTEKAKSATAFQEISTKYSSLNGQYQSLKSEQDTLNTDAQVHETRSGNECQQRYCEGR